MRLFTFLLILDSIFLNGFFRFFCLLDVFLFYFHRCILSHLGLVFGGAPGARSTTSTTLGSVGRCGNRNTSYQAGNPKPCYETLDLTLVHDLTTFLNRDDLTNTLRFSLAIEIYISIVIYDNTTFITLNLPRPIVTQAHRTSKTDD